MISAAIFCERIDEDDRGVQSFINVIDTLSFSEVGSDEQTVWRGMLGIDVVFGDDRETVQIEVAQVEPGPGQRKSVYQHELDPADYPGMLSVSMSLNFAAAFERSGVYWYEFNLNGELKARVPLTIRIDEG